jgi:outer membrane protein assembly factor BamB
VTRRDRLRRGAPVAALVLLGAVACASCATAARQHDPADEPAHPAGVLQVRWRVPLHEHGLFEASPEECASGVMAHGRLVIGSRAGSVVGVDPAHGHVDWATTLSGGVDAEARFDQARDQIYVGADDGNFYALDAGRGTVRWSYHAKGAIDRAAEFGEGAASAGLVYLATAADRVLALDAATGKWRWQYERETPEGFTIHGHAGPRLRGAMLLTGFADGYIVSLAAATGDVQWARSLAAASDQFVDVDSTPTVGSLSKPGLEDVVFASSYSGGLYALEARDGGIRWRLPIEGVGAVTQADDRIYFAAPRQGLHAADRQGHVVWRQGLTAAGDLTRPLVLGKYLLFSGSRAGLFVVDRATGELLEVFNPGQGICASATVDLAAHRLYLLSNGGSLYALDLA